jgi:TPR repeat protein
MDKTKAAQLYGQAAEQGHAEAQYNLGVRYSKG